jgi:hypothetical protein
MFESSLGSTNDSSIARTIYSDPNTSYINLTSINDGRPVPVRLKIKVVPYFGFDSTGITETNYVRRFSSLLSRFAEAIPKLQQLLDGTPSYNNNGSLTPLEVYAICTSSRLPPTDEP